MSKQISYSIIDDIIKILVNKKYKAVQNELLDKIKAYFKEYWESHIPKDIYDYFKSLDEKEQLQNFRCGSSFSLSSWTLSNKYSYRYNDLKTYALSVRDNLGFFYDENILTFTRNTNNYNDIFTVIEDNDEFLKMVTDYYKVLYDKNSLSKKLECVLKAKRYYPNSLKNDFPEAYEVFEKLQKNPLQKEVNGNLCDSVENLRAILQSNKK